MKNFINLEKRVALFYIFANLFNVWLNRRKLHSHIFFDIQSVAIQYFEVQEENTASHWQEVGKGKTPQNSERALGAPRTHLRTTTTLCI